MDIDEKYLLGLLTVAGGWLASFFLQAKRVGEMEERFKQTESMTKENGLSIARLKQLHDEDMASIRAFFTNAAGGQKFITFIDHDLMCERNMKDHAKDLRYLREAIDKQTAQLNAISSDVAALKTDMAVVKERRKGSREED